MTSSWQLSQVPFEDIVPWSKKANYDQDVFGNFTVAQVVVSFIHTQLEKMQPIIQLDVYTNAYVPIGSDWVETTA